jgi:hypothetical protein
MSQVDGEKHNTEIMLLVLQLQYSHAKSAAIIQSNERQERAKILLEVLTQAKQRWISIKLKELSCVTEPECKEHAADVTTSG